MRALLSLSLIGRAALLLACLALTAPSNSYAAEPQVQRFTGTVTKIDPNSKIMVIAVGKRTVELKRSDFDLVTLIHNGKKSNFNLDNAQLLKLSIKIEITTEEDKNGKKKKHLTIEIVSS